MKWALVILPLLFLFSGCGFFHSSSRTSIRNFYPRKNSESFLAVRSEDENDSKSIIRIDSDGILNTVVTLDSRYNQSGCGILNDSIVLILVNPQEESKCLLYNISSQSLVDSLPGLPVAWTGPYFALYDTDQLTRGYISCYLNGNKVMKIASTRGSYNFFHKAEIDNYFLATAMVDSGWRMDKIVLNSDFTIFDTIHGSGFFSFQGSGKGNDEVLYIAEDSKKVWSYACCYHLTSRRTDTLFSCRDITEILSIQNSDYYLFCGILTDKEYLDQKHIISEEISKRGEFIDYTIHPDGYWMIGNFKTKRILKVGYQHYKQKISASGRHILFSKDYQDEKDIKVVPVKELIEGMEK